MRLAALLPLFILQFAPTIADPHPLDRLAPDCAALWLGFAAYTRSANDLTLGRAFTRLALRLSDDPETTAAQIRESRRAMTMLADEVIYSRDPGARDIFEDLARDCEALGFLHPETSGVLQR